MPESFFKVLDQLFDSWWPWIVCYAVAALALHWEAQHLAM